MIFLNKIVPWCVRVLKSIIKMTAAKVQSTHTPNIPIPFEDNLLSSALVLFRRYDERLRLSSRRSSLSIFIFSWRLIVRRSSSSLEFELQVQFKNELEDELITVVGFSFVKISDFVVVFFSFMISVKIQFKFSFFYFHALWCEIIQQEIKYRSTTTDLHFMVWNDLFSYELLFCLEKLHIFRIEYEFFLQRSPSFKKY